MLETSLDFTPGDTLERATRLNNLFQLLWRALPLAKQRRALDAAMAGWEVEYTDIRESYFTRATSFGKVTEWEKIYMKLRSKFEHEGADLSRVPLLVPGKGAVLPDIGVVIKADAPIKKVEKLIDKKMKEAKEIIEEEEGTTKEIILFGVGALVVGGLIFWSAIKK